MTGLTPILKKRIASLTWWWFEVPDNEVSSYIVQYNAIYNTHI